MTSALHMTAQRIDHRQAGGSDLLVRLAGNALPGFPRFDPTAPTTRATPQPAVIDAVADYNASVGNRLNDATLAALHNGGRMIIGGQQPGLLTGPLYTFLKAATAIAMCRELQASTDVPLVPAFWLATEDHDIEEVNRVRIGGKTLVIDHAELRGGPRPPVGALSLEHAHDRVLTFLQETLRTAPHGREVVEAVAACDFADYGRLCATLLVRLFGTGVIVLVDPMTLRQPAAPVLARAIEQRDTVREALTSGAATLRRSDLKPPLDRVSLFEFVEGRRMRINLHDPRLSAPQLAQNILDEPMRYSPSAALRPVVQDAILPTLITLGGPSELAYLWQIDGIYRALGVDRSALWPRSSATFIDQAIADSAAHFGLAGEAILTAPEMLGQFDPSQLDAEDLLQIEALRDQLLAHLDTLADEVPPKLMRRAHDSIAYRIRHVTNRAREHRLSARGMGKGDLGRVAASVRPEGKPQERAMNVLELVARYGWPVIDETIARLEPMTLAHQLMVVRSS
jgi:bacillithiol biosynthesis cysteine-adding enzyme BshC